MNLVVHPIAGFDYLSAREKFSVPENYSIEIIIAVGKPGKMEDLPEPLRARETPNDRKPLEEIISEGKFKF